MPRVGIALGTNLGDRLANLQAAREALQEIATPGAAFLQASIYQTEPLYCPPGSPFFYNSVVEIAYEGNPSDLLSLTQSIEIKLGRLRDPERNAPRIIDVDLLYFGDQIVDTEALVLPHPRIGERRFVLQPLADIRPELVLPGSRQCILERLENLISDEPPLVRVDLANPKPSQEITMTSRHLYFITHPNVWIDPTVPVPQWPLSERGLARMRRTLNLPWIHSVSAIYSSTEQKAIDGAGILSDFLALPFSPQAGLGENDRSATGYLPPEEFEKVADEFFAKPDQSIRGWERAIDAQERIVSSVMSILANEQSNGSIAIVSHGAVGALLYCHFAGHPIDRQWDQPPTGGGNYFTISLPSLSVVHGWLPID